MTRPVRILVGAVVGMVGCVSLAAAQGTLPGTPTDWMNVVGMGSGAGALVAWGIQTEKVRSHSRRLEALESNQMTRAEFLSRHEELREDIRRLFDLIDRRRLPRD